MTNQCTIFHARCAFLRLAAASLACLAIAGCSSLNRGALELPAVAAVEMAAATRCSQGKADTAALLALRAAYDTLVAPTAGEEARAKVKALRAITDAACQLSLGAATTATPGEN